MTFVFSTSPDLRWVGETALVFKASSPSTPLYFTSPTSIAAPVTTTSMSHTVTIPSPLTMPAAPRQSSQSQFLRRHKTFCTTLIHLHSLLPSLPQAVWNLSPFSFCLSLSQSLSLSLSICLSLSPTSSGPTHNFALPPATNDFTGKRNLACLYK